jgi:DNA polymerase (family 10)
LRQYSAALGQTGADRFKVAAYRRAADTVDRVSQSLADLVGRAGSLQGLSGIGAGISKVIAEVIETGRLKALDEALKQMTPELREVASRPQLDPKKVARAYKALGVHSFEELRLALEGGQVRSKLGANLELHLQQGLSDRRRLLWWEADKLAVEIESFLARVPGVQKVARVGSLRRMQETIGDLGFLIACRSATSVFRKFEGFGAVERLPSQNRRTASFRTSSSVEITLTSAPGSEWGARLIEATGSTVHVAQLSKVAAKGAPRTKNAFGRLSEEREVYRRLGMTWIPPELREGTGEIEAAREDKLPVLLEVADLRGDLHMHTTASDGANSLEEMVEAAQARGYEYIAITEHSKSLRIANGLSEKELLAHIRRIDKLNEKLSNFTILKSAEVDILEDGTLDYSDSVLKLLDLTVCSIHSRFALDRKKQTDRLLRAMDSPYFGILGHATGRKLLRRQGYDIDAEKVLKRVKANHCFVEINSNPNRLDLSAENARLAKSLGLKIAVNTDAHSVDELRFIRAGVNQARRAWLEKDDVINTRSIAQLRRIFRR